MTLSEYLEVERLLVITETCWLWRGPKDSDGYGLFKGKGKVHRLMVEVYLGLKKEEWVLHKLECPNRHCVNPEHLYIGTHKQNMEDMKALGHARGGGKTQPRPYCRRGHEKNEENTYRGGQCKVCMREKQREKARLTNEQR